MATATQTGTETEAPNTATSEAAGYRPVGTRSFDSSNQSSTTCSVGPALAILLTVQRLPFGQGPAQCLLCSGGCGDHLRGGAGVGPFDDAEQ